MHLNASIHIRPGDEIEFRRGGTDPTVQWLAVDAVALFGELPELIRLREALDEMIAAKQSASQKKAA